MRGLEWTGVISTHKLKMQKVAYLHGMIDTLQSIMYLYVTLFLHN